MADPAPTSSAPATQAAGQASQSQPQSSAPGRTIEPIIQPPGQPGGGGEPAKPSQEEAFKEWVKQHGPLKVKAKGKEHAVEDLPTLVRYAQQAIPMQETREEIAGKLQEIAKRRQELEPIAEAFAALQSGDPDAAETVITHLMGGGEKLQKLAERVLMREIKREKSEEGMTERERAMSAQLRQLQQAQAQAERERKEAGERQRREQEQQAQAQATKQLQEHLTAALRAAKLSEAAAPRAARYVLPLIEASLRAGQFPDPEMTAQEMRSLLQEDVRGLAGGLEGEELLETFGPEVAAKFQAALLARLRSKSGRPAVPAQGQPPSSQSNGAPKPSFDPRNRSWY